MVACLSSSHLFCLEVVGGIHFGEGRLGGRGVGGGVNKHGARTGDLERGRLGVWGGSGEGRPGGGGVLP
jgi:hypothetical protein